jgi:hypothetical protein
MFGNATFLRFVPVHSVRSVVAQGVPRALGPLVEHLAQRSLVLESEAFFRPELELVRFRFSRGGSETLGTASAFPAVRVGWFSGWSKSAPSLWMGSETPIRSLQSTKSTARFVFSVW